jgi:hypothetical protein
MKPETNSKLQTVVKCYEEFKIQPYLNNNLPKSIMKHLTKLRISAHTIQLEISMMYYININGQNISSELTTMNRKS